jgi:hypothetical protein
MREPVARFFHVPVRQDEREHRRFPHGRNSTGQVFRLLKRSHGRLETPAAAENLLDGINP